LNSSPHTIGSLLAQATGRLGTESARLEAEVLLAVCLDRPRSHLHAWPEREIEPRQQEEFATLLRRRLDGMPVAYLLARREFWSLPFTVTPDTLIPRPETETLVALALETMPVGSPLRIADLGTGCGAIALAIARERPRSEIIATDISLAALAVAKANGSRLGLTNVQFVAGSWCDALSAAAFDSILSTPPYVAEADPHLQEGDVRFEPRTALASGPRGMDALQRIITCAHYHLRPDGWLIVEHSHDQGDEVIRLMQGMQYGEVSDHADASGLSRVTMGRR
jgi:release factor glutamine methyltransferase